ncbi:GSCFA domain-containing protein [Hymenobacter guriensis]|uniref:GSCFA domain-containing protein n=1 Tax=Hymenobacter guriensis TaxID=2793065 RepID=A0ABS0L8G6_9BACT|nr:GSCFA domain-containing protein [Hymenobacter guriensis]MBG8556443.1 GSCFA domain-containing protein [Hymenobacter guriensis]
MFRTELPLTPHPQQLPPSARVLTVGSCFADTIGSRLADYKVATLVNPFGTVFNPITACQLLRTAAGEDMDWQQHLVEARSRWQSYDLAASLGAENPVALLQRIQEVVRETGAFLAQTDVVMLTLGTAFVYRLKETGELVSNCHKIPAERFEKELLTPDEIINAVAETHAYLRRINPRLRFILTVSPVRHIKDTLPLNSVSKSVLRVACHYLSELLPDISYFPAYELLLDDLRDYRFYAPDMLHPSPVAEDYIWEKFTRTYFDQSFGRFKKEWEAVRQALAHRPLYAAAPEHRQFLEQTLERLERLSTQASVQAELATVRQRIAELPLPPAPPQPTPEPEEDDEERIDVGEEAPVAVQEPLDAEAQLDSALEWPDEDVEEDEADEEPEAADTLAEAVGAALEGEQPLIRKKRRSRGGAKRNKKKHAARLAAEAEALAATTATLSQLLPTAEADAAVEPVADSLPSSFPPSPPAVVTEQPDMPLQTALERRKRNSRRSKNRKPALPEASALEQTEETQASAVETADQPQQAAEPSDEWVAETAQSLEPGLPVAAPEADANNASEFDTTEPAGDDTQGGRREGRSGRSASERRAAAVRKPHRPAPRFKPLYAAESAPATEEASVPAVSESPVSQVLPDELQVNNTEWVDAPVAAPEPSAAPTPEPVVPVVAASIEVAPAGSAVASAPAAPKPLIPHTVGTGASGNLSSTGQASRQARPGRAKQPTEVAIEAPAAEVPVAEAPGQPAVAVTPPAAPATPKPAARPRPARKKPVASTVTPGTATAETTETPPAAPVAGNKRPARSSKPKAAAPETPTEAPAPKVPAARKRGKAPTAAQPEAPTAPAETPAPSAPKRVRPSRRKPTAPDTGAENA